MKELIICFFIILFIPQAFAYTDVTTDEVIKWALSTQKPDGSFTMIPSSNWVQPFFDNHLAISLVQNGQYTPVKNYMNWYFSHMETDGTMSDWIGGINQHKSDSVDATSASFLTLSREYYDRAGDKSFITSHNTDLQKIVKSIDILVQPSGLTIAKSDYPFQYFEDNVDVWRGYNDYSIYLNMINSTDARIYQTKAEGVRAGLETLWVNNSYLVYLGGPPINWNTFYPDAQAQSWGIIYQLPETIARENILWKSFMQNQPRWDAIRFFMPPNTITGLAGMWNNEDNFIFKSIMNTIYGDNLNVGKFSIVEVEGMLGILNPSNLPSTVMGTVYKDTNRNGIKDLGEVGIKNVVIQSYSYTDGKYLLPTKTDNNGKYYFSHPPLGGIAILQGYTGTPFTQPSNGAYYTSIKGGTLYTLDFGNK